MKRIRDLITALLIIILGASTFVLIQKVRDENVLNEDKQIVQIDEEKSEENLVQDKLLPEASMDIEIIGDNENSTEELAKVDETTMMVPESSIPEEEPETATPKQAADSEAKTVDTPKVEKATVVVKLPDGKGMKTDDYLALVLKNSAIQASGLESNVKYSHSSSVPKGIIISVDSDISDFKPGSMLNITESIGPEAKEKAEVESFKSYEEKLPNVPALTINYAYTFDSALENEILRLLNEYRKANGLNELQMDETLRKISRWKSNSQIQNNYFGHSDVNHGYTADIIDYKMDGVSERYTALGENLHFTTKVSTSASSIVEAWKKSPGHNQNMLEPWWTHVGIGVAKANNAGSAFHDQGATLSTQVFGSK